MTITPTKAAYNAAMTILQNLPNDAERHQMANDWIADHYKNLANVYKRGKALAAMKVLSEIRERERVRNSV